MFLDLRGQKVHTTDYGSGETTIVGIAGAFGNVEIWHQPFELLSRRHRVIAYDHFGTGETRVPPERVNFEEQVALLGDLLDALDVERCVLAGDSNMVAVAVQAVLRWPERFEALALVAGGVAHHENEITRRFIRGLRTDFERTIDAFVALCIPEEGSAHLRAWLQDIIHRTGGERAALVLESFTSIDLTDRLGEITVPTVIVQGEEDVMPTSTAENGRSMTDSIQDCTLELLPGVGHVPTLTRPEQVARAIERLIERSRAATVANRAVAVHAET